MIADLDETLRNMLIAEIPVKNGEVEISFHQPRREWSTRLTRPTLNLFLYKVAQNAALSRHEWEELPGSRQNGQAQRKRSPLRVDCTYLLTAWAADPQDEHRLLTRAMMALFRAPIIPEERLANTLKNQPYPIQAILADHQPENPSEIWSALDNEVRPTISYRLTIALDPWQVFTGPLVRTFTLRTGQSEQLPLHPDFKIDGISAESLFFGGTIRQKGGDRAPRPAVQVAIKGTGLFTITDKDGRFTLGGLPAGQYTLIAWPPEGRPVEKVITLPSNKGDYDLEF